MWGRFLTDPLDVPDIVVDYVAAQVGVQYVGCADPKRST